MFIEVYRGGKVARSIQELASVYPHPDWSVALLICMLLDNRVALQPPGVKDWNPPLIS